MPVIVNPHPDLELGAERRPLHYAEALPEAGIGPETGLVFFIHGFGASFDDAYTQKLLPFLANTHDCVAVAVDYHDAHATNRIKMTPAPNFFEALKYRHGVSVNMPPEPFFEGALKKLFEILADSGIEMLHEDCFLLGGPELYMNFGLLAALDHLTVLHKVLELYPINRRRLFVLGTSYGGYIALMMRKIAPNSFRLVIDNSGFSNVADASGVAYGVTLPLSRPKVAHRCVLAFSADPSSARFMGAARQSIRDLAVAEHYGMSGGCVTYTYHSRTDKVASAAAKELVVAQARQLGHHHDLRLIEAGDVDGRLFKDTDHGMSASMRELFRLSHERWRQSGGSDIEHTDFDLGTVNSLMCAELDYVFSFDRAGVRLCIC